MKDMTTPLPFQDEMPVFKNLASVADIANMSAKGRAKAEAGGLAKGRAETIRQNAISLKKQGVSSEIIATAPGLTIEEVEDLQ